MIFFELLNIFFLVSDFLYMLISADFFYVDGFENRFLELSVFVVF